jgi:hypothetical protein
MEEFKKYYKFPLKMWKDFYSKVFTQENNMAFDWLLPYGEKYNDLKEKLLNKINGEEVNINKTFYHKEGYIYARGEVIDIKVALIRGWGMLTGGGGYNLPQEKAAEIQDAFAEYCVKALNKNNE